MTFYDFVKHFKKVLSFIKGYQRTKRRFIKGYQRTKRRFIKDSSIQILDIRNGSFVTKVQKGFKFIKLGF